MDKLNLYDSKNVLGKPLRVCCMDPTTGFFRNGCCDTNDDDHGVHTVCVIVTKTFLAFSKENGNDLSTPNVEFGFPGLKEGDKWCLCASRWVEALKMGVAPQIILSATHERTLDFVDLDTLKKYAIDS